MGLTVPKPKPSVLLTRPQAQSEQFAQALKEHGFAGNIVIAPLLKISPVAPAPNLDGFDGVIFTSRNAVDFVDPKDIPAWCVGDKTASKARAQGWEAKSADGSADELINAVLAARTAGKLIHLRGKHSRSEVAHRLNRAGIETKEHILYDQVERRLSTEAHALLAGVSPVIAPLFSPRTARVFASQGPFKAPIIPLAMSGAVAKELQNSVSERVVVAAKPTAKSMLESMLSLIDAA